MEMTFATAPESIFSDARGPTSTCVLQRARAHGIRAGFEQDAVRRIANLWLTRARDHMPLTPEQLYFADRLFELRILRANGQAFQDLFTRLMGLRHSDFRPVKPQGSIGDRKNDGFHASAGRYYQVYAPEKHDPKDVAKTVGKISRDFAGLKKY